MNRLSLCTPYTELYHQLDDWVFDNLSGEELEYYISTTD